jgi:hypothetical protein
MCTEHFLNGIQVSGISYLPISEHTYVQAPYPERTLNVH